MLMLNDGRSELWQWDTGRKLTVDADCSQVHFNNKVFGRSIDVDVVDGVAVIPDILLQTDKDLNVWAFVGTPENGYTKISKVFKVNKRSKPADYVFTPPEQTTLEEIKEKIEYLESIQDPDAIKNAVEDYLEHNPVEAPVQSVNGKTGEIQLTADDVGAISHDDLQEATDKALAQAKASGEFDGADGKDGKDGADGYTPVKGVDYFDGKDGKDGADGQPGEKGDPGDDYVLTDADKQEIAEQAAELVEVPSVDIPTTLPNPNALTFTGAATGTYDGSVPLTVNIPKGGGGGTGEWKRIATITTAEEVNSVSWTTFEDGTPLNANRFFVHYELPKKESGNNRIICTDDNNVVVEILSVLTDKVTRIDTDVRAGYFIVDLMSYNSSNMVSSMNAYVGAHPGYPYSGSGVFKKIELGYNLATSMIAIGSKFDVWGFVK